MRVLILGANGMLGHKVYQKFAGKYDTYATFRTEDSYKKHDFFDKNKAIVCSPVADIEILRNVLSDIKPHYVINCTGITKQQSLSEITIKMISVNSLFPQRLSFICENAGIKVIHISTDCVFSGKKGYYNEDDFTDADDTYGRTKFMGEVIDKKHVLTIRTSIIGRELRTSYGLLEWFLSQTGGTVKGYVNAIFTGFTTITLVDIISNIMERHPELNGLYHISSDPINKYELLNLIRSEFKLDINVKPYEDFFCDRSLDSSKFRKETGFAPETWGKMIKKMADENEQYEEWRKL